MTLNCFLYFFVIRRSSFPLPRPPPSVHLQGHFSVIVSGIYSKKKTMYSLWGRARDRERERGIIKASPSLERCALLYPRITRVFFSFQTFSLLDTHLPSLSFKKPSWNFYRYSPDIFSLFLKHKSNSVKICLFVLKLSFNERIETRYARSWADQITQWVCSYFHLISRRFLFVWVIIVCGRNHYESFAKTWISSHHYFFFFVIRSFRFFRFFFSSYSSGPQLRFFWSILLFDSSAISSLRFLRSLFVSFFHRFVCIGNLISAVLIEDFLVNLNLEGKFEDYKYWGGAKKKMVRVCMFVRTSSRCRLITECGNYRRIYTCTYIHRVCIFYEAYQ